MNTLTGESLLKSCDPVQTVAEATRPVVTPLLPVKGLRRDASGNLTDDAIKTILDGVKSLGVEINSEASRDAILQEARSALCRFYAQYSFLVNMFTVAMSRAEPFDSAMFATLKEKLQAMRDIVGVAQYVINTMPEGGPLKESFIVGKKPSGSKEAFQTLADSLADQQQLVNTKNLFQLKQRALEDTEEKNTYASRQLGLYAFMNIVAVGLLFYILSV